MQIIMIFSLESLFPKIEARLFPWLYPSSASFSTPVIKSIMFFPKTYRTRFECHKFCPPISIHIVVGDYLEAIQG